MGLNNSNASIKELLSRRTVLSPVVLSPVVQHNKNNTTNKILEKIYKKLEESEKHHKRTTELNERLLEENKALKKIAKVNQKITLMGDVT